jgi:CheY-like chemotaxis protein
VLVVEDDAELRDLYRITLTIAGYAVIAVEDGFDALQRIEQFIPSAVILDMELPRLGGRDVHRELAAHPETRNIPIVVVSGTDISDLNSADFACVLKKPIQPDAIVDTIDRCLGLR